MNDKLISQFKMKGGHLKEGTFKFSISKNKNYINMVINISGSEITNEIIPGILNSLNKKVNSRFQENKKIKTNPLMTNKIIIINNGKIVINNNGRKGIIIKICFLHGEEQLKKGESNNTKKEYFKYDNIGGNKINKVNNQINLNNETSFVQQTLAIIHEHISDGSFGVEMLAREMAVSRSLLLKKLETLVGEPPKELIKITRLNEAAKLIENNFGNIAEIALEVGFSNPSYFAECFKKQFGVIPSQYH